MSESDRLRTENQALRTRLARLSEAILRISDGLDLKTVLQEIADNACSLTDARYRAITMLNESWDLQDFVIYGLRPEQKRELIKYPRGYTLLEHMDGNQTPLNTQDFVAYAKPLGFPDFHPPVGAFLAVPIRDRDKYVGHVCVGEKRNAPDFTQEDVETLEMFANQAAMAITNARRYGEELQAKADLEALVNTSPVGVVVFDAKTYAVVKFNREARRIMGGARRSDRDFEQLLELATFRWTDGREIPSNELPTERALSNGETVRAEEIVIHLPDGESVTSLVNATPIYSEDGEVMSVIATIQDITPLEELARMRAEFLGMVSHELRTPLTAIKGSTATVRDTSVPLDPAETRQFFRIIEEQAGPYARPDQQSSRPDTDRDGDPLGGS